MKPLPLVSLALTLTLGLVAAAAPAGPSTKNTDQVRVCRDFSRPGTRITKRVCRTPAEVEAYERQDFERHAMNPLTGGSAWCWRANDKKWTEPCANKAPQQL